MNNKPGFRIRKATPVDARAISEVHVRTWQIAYVDYFTSGYLKGQGVFLEEPALRRREEALAGSAQTTLVAEIDGSIVGFVTYLINQDELGDEVGEVGAIYVDPDYWDRGVGTGLITAAEAGLTALGYKIAILWTIGANERTRSFYERRGWSFDGTTKPHRSGIDLVRYAKRLSP